MSGRRCFVVTVAVLVAFNVARAVGVPGLGSVAGAIGLTAVVTVIAWRAGLTAADLGLERRDAWSGARYGLAAFALTIAVLLAAAVIPATSGFLDDSRVDVSAPGLVYEVVVSIFVATVVPEELAFRGVLLASGRAEWGVRRAVLFSSALFGLWHISPSLHTMSQNSQLTGTTSTIAGVAGNVGVTFTAGLIFCWLRLRSRSLLAPVLAHFATNGVAFVVAWAVWTR